MKRFDTFRLDGVRRTPAGGLRADATLTRSGVFLYHNPDGSQRRELRHPDVVFNEDSLASMKGATITVGHPAEGVTPDNYQKLSVGHIGDDPRRDGHLVRATVYVNDAKAVADVLAGKLLEFSMGYDVSLVTEAGEYEGERYDAKQVNPVYNHAALLPPGHGRAGSEVRLRLDSKGDQITHEDVSNPLGMELAEALKALAKAEAERDALKARVDSLTVDLDKQTARADANQTSLEKANQATKEAEAKLPALLAAALKLREDARVVLGAEDLAGKTDREILVAVCAKAGFKADEKTTDTYLQARFDIACENARKDENEESLSEVQRAAVGSEDDNRQDEADDELVGAWAAREKMLEANRKLASQKVGK